MAKCYYCGGGTNHPYRVPVELELATGTKGTKTIDLCPHCYKNDYSLRSAIEHAKKKMARPAVKPEKETPSRLDEKEKSDEDS